MLTVTKDLVLPCTVTGSWPRPRWFDVSPWGRPLDTCMLDVRWREKYLDALATLISDEERAGLDLLTHGDFHCDDDFAGRSWHHYPLQRWAGFEGLAAGKWQVLASAAELDPSSGTYSSLDEAQPIEWSCEVSAGRTTRYDLDLRSK